MVPGAAGATESASEAAAAVDLTVQEPAKLTKGDLARVMAEPSVKALQNLGYETKLELDAMPNLAIIKVRKPGLDGAVMALGLSSVKLSEERGRSYYVPASASPDAGRRWDGTTSLYVMAEIGTTSRYVDGQRQALSPHDAGRIWSEAQLQAYRGPGDHYVPEHRPDLSIPERVVQEVKTFFEVRVPHAVHYAEQENNAADRQRREARGADKARTERAEGFLQHARHEFNHTCWSVAMQLGVPVDSLQTRIDGLSGLQTNRDDTDNPTLRVMGWINAEKTYQTVPNDVEGSPLERHEAFHLQISLSETEPVQGAPVSRTVVDFKKTHEVRVAPGHSMNFEALMAFTNSPGTDADIDQANRQHRQATRR